MIHYVCEKFSNGTKATDNESIIKALLLVLQYFDFALKCTLFMHKNYNCILCYQSFNKKIILHWTVWLKCKNLYPIHLYLYIPWNICSTYGCLCLMLLRKGQIKPESIGQFRNGPLTGLHDQWQKGNYMCKWLVIIGSCCRRLLKRLGYLACNEHRTHEVLFVCMTDQKTLPHTRTYTGQLGPGCIITWILQWLWSGGDPRIWPLSGRLFQHILTTHIQHFQHYNLKKKAIACM